MQEIKIYNVYKLIHSNIFDQHTSEKILSLTASFRNEDEAKNYIKNNGYNYDLIMMPGIQYVRVGL